MSVWGGTVNEVTNTKWGHGLLQPIDVTYYMWGQKDTAGNKLPKEEVAFEKWAKLPSNQRGQKLVISVNPKVVNPDLDFVVQRTMVDAFPAWTQFTLPSINDVMGMDKKIAPNEFAKRAASLLWYVEYQMVPTGEKMQDGNDATTFVFTRMTRELGELKAWHDERYPKKDKLTDAMIENLDNMWRFAKGDRTKFENFIVQDEELRPHLAEILRMSQYQPA